MNIEKNTRNVGIVGIDRLRVGAAPLENLQTFVPNGVFYTNLMNMNFNRGEAE